MLLFGAGKQTFNKNFTQNVMNLIELLYSRILTRSKRTMCLYLQIMTQLMRTKKGKSFVWMEK